MLARVGCLSLVLVAIGCPSPTTPVAPPECDGHALGTTFPADDGCNSCVCEVGGVSCTEMDCSDVDAGPAAPHDGGEPAADTGEAVVDAGEAVVDAGEAIGDAGGPVVDAGEAVVDAGGDGQMCGTRGAAPCPEGSFCNHPIGANCGRTDQPGVCEVYPDGCDRRLDPVCGCDGDTYDNACRAAMEGVSVDYEGVCAGGCADNGDCGRGEYCARQLGRCEEGGECQRRPDGCGGIFDPVCGCDGQTYGNACEAATNGVNIAREGACQAGPQACQDNRDCFEGFYCQRPDGQCAEEGECMERPIRCTPAVRWVCGCDGESYRNACLAQVAGTSVAAAGPCGDGGGAPGGAGDTCDMERPCGAPFFCDRPEGQCAAEGTCVIRPEICNRLFAPVCGCDGENYSNPCVANSGGTSVNYRGDCR